MVKYFRHAREEKPTGLLRDAARGGLVVEGAFLDSREGRELEASTNLRVTSLIERLGVYDIRYEYGLKTVSIIINFGSIPLVNLSDKPPFNLDFSQDSLARLNEALPEPIYHISHEVRAFFDAGAPRISGVSDIMYKPTSPWRTSFPYITIHVSTGETTSRKLPMTYSHTDVGAIFCGKDSRLEAKRVNGLPFGINARYEVTIVEPVKTIIQVHSDVNGSCVKVREDDIDNPNVARALDAVVEHLFHRDIAPKSMIRK